MINSPSKSIVGIIVSLVLLVSCLVWSANAFELNQIRYFDPVKGTLVSVTNASSVLNYQFIGVQLDIQFVDSDDHCSQNNPCDFQRNDILPYQLPLIPPMTKNAYNFYQIPSDQMNPFNAKGWTPSSPNPDLEVGTQHVKVLSFRKGLYSYYGVIQIGNVTTNIFNGCSIQFRSFDYESGVALISITPPTSQTQLTVGSYPLNAIDGLRINMYAYQTAQYTETLNCYDSEDFTKSKIVGRLSLFPVAGYTAVDIFIRDVSVDVFDNNVSAVYCQLYTLSKPIPRIGGMGSMTETQTLEWANFEFLLNWHSDLMVSDASTGERTPLAPQAIPYISPNWLTIANDPTKTSEFPQYIITRPQFSVSSTKSFSATTFQLYSEASAIAQFSFSLDSDKGFCDAQNSSNILVQYFKNTLTNLEQFELTAGGWDKLVADFPLEDKLQPQAPGLNMWMVYETGKSDVPYDSLRWMPSYLHISKAFDVNFVDTVQGILQLDFKVELEKYSIFGVIQGEGFATTFPFFGMLELDSMFSQKVHCDIADVSTGTKPLKTLTTFVDDTIYVQFDETYRNPDYYQDKHIPTLDIQCYMRILPSVLMSSDTNLGETSGGQFVGLFQLFGFANAKSEEGGSVGMITPVHSRTGTQFSKPTVGIFDNFKWNGAKIESTSPSEKVTRLRCTSDLLIHVTDVEKIQGAQNKCREQLLKAAEGATTSYLVIFPLEHYGHLGPELPSASPWLLFSGYRDFITQSKSIQHRVAFHTFTALVWFDGLAEQGVMPSNFDADVLSSPLITKEKIKTYLKPGSCTTQDDGVFDTDQEGCVQSKLAIYSLHDNLKGRFPFFKKRFGETCQHHHECIYYCDFFETKNYIPASQDRNGKCSTNPYVEYDGTEGLLYPPSSVFSAQSKTTFNDEDRAANNFNVKVGFTTSPTEIPSAMKQCSKFPTSKCCAAYKDSFSEKSGCYCVLQASSLSNDEKKVCVLAYPHLSEELQATEILTNSIFNYNSLKWNPQTSCFHQSLPKFFDQSDLIPVLHLSPLLAKKCHQSGFFTVHSLNALELLPSLPSVVPSWSTKQILINNNRLPFKQSQLTFSQPTAFATPFKFDNSEKVFSVYISTAALAQLQCTASSLSLLIGGTNQSNPDAVSPISFYITSIFSSISSNNIQTQDITFSDLLKDKTRVTDLYVAVTCSDTTAGLRSPILTTTVAGYQIEYRSSLYVEPKQCQASQGLVRDVTKNECVCSTKNYKFDQNLQMCIPPCLCGEKGTCQYFTKSGISFATVADIQSGNANFFNYQCLCQEGFYHRFCDVPVACREIKCLLPGTQDGSTDPYAIPAVKSNGSVQCSQQCGCIKGFVKDSTGKCVCEKMLDTSLNQCSLIGTHTVATTAARCLIGSSNSAELGFDIELEVENEIDLEPWLKNVPCPCRYGYAGSKCQYEATYFVFEVLDTDRQQLSSTEIEKNVFGSNTSVRSFWYAQTKEMLISIRNEIKQAGDNSQLFMSLYKWDPATQTAVVQLWFQPQSQPNGFVSTSSTSGVMTSKSPQERQVYNRLLISTQNAVKELMLKQQQLHQQQSVMTPLNLEDLYNLWGAVTQPTTPPVTIVPGEQSSYPQSNFNPRCSDPTFASDNAQLCVVELPTYDDAYGEEMNQDKNQTDHQGDLTYFVEMDSSSSNTTTIIIIAVVVPVCAIILFVVVACLIKYCYTNKKACFAKPSKKQHNSSNTSSGSGSAVALSSTRSGSGSGSGVTSQQSSSLPASIMPSSPNASSTTSAKLPDGWQEQTDSSGKVYYMNLTTMQSQWDMPAADGSTNNKGGESGSGMAW